MGIGVSILLAAIGAVLIWGVSYEVAGMDVDAIGWILLIVGAIGVLLSMIFWSSWGGFHRRSATYVEGEPVRRVATPRRATTVVEEDEIAPGPPGPPL